MWTVEIEPSELAEYIRDRERLSMIYHLISSSIVEKCDCSIGLHYTCDEDLLKLYKCFCPAEYKKIAESLRSKSQTDTES